MSGVRVSVLTNFNFFSENPYMSLGVLSIPLTIIWIVGMTNAVNFIDGLDGLAVGVSSIGTFSILAIAVLVSERDVALIAAILCGACMGFFPYNLNPAKIFMGDTGATFLGFTLAVLSIQGLFKMYAVISFFVPFLIFGLPIFDTAFAMLRRILAGKSPMEADRGHLHHRLIDMGFSQKQAVAIMYVVSAILGPVGRPANHHHRGSGAAGHQLRRGAGGLRRQDHGRPPCRAAARRTPAERLSKGEPS